MALLMVLEALLGCEQAWTPNIYLKSFDMDSVQVGKAVFVKESYTTLGIEPRTYSRCPMVAHYKVESRNTTSNP